MIRRLLRAIADRFRDDSWLQDMRHSEAAAKREAKNVELGNQRQDNERVNFIYDRITKRGGCNE